jgi:hypothetical protein
MSQIQIRPVLPVINRLAALWQAYLRFYNTELPDRCHPQHLAALPRPERTDSCRLAWADGKAVGMVHFIYHRSNWSIENSCYLQTRQVPETRARRRTPADRTRLRHCQGRRLL